MGCNAMRRKVLNTVVVLSVLLTSAPAFAQVELGGTYAIRMYEDYIERGPGSFLGDFTGMPMSDEGRAKALRYSSSLPSMIERQCLAQSPWVGLYRPLAIRIWNEVDESGRVVAWVMGGDYLRDTVRIWMDGRPHPGEFAPHTWPSTYIRPKIRHHLCRCGSVDLAAFGLGRLAVHLKQYIGYSNLRSEEFIIS